MNRKELIDGLKKAGYAGPSDLASVEAWVKDNNIVPEDADGKPIDIKAAFAATKSVKIAAPVEEKAVVVEAEEPEVEEPAAPSAESMLRKSRAAAAASVKGAPAIGNSERRMACKAYEHKIKETATLNPQDRRKAAFDSVEQAEFAGAHLRLAFSNLKGFTYSQRENDIAILDSVRAKASTETNNTSAGVLVAPEYLPNVLWLTENYGVARRLANVQRFSRTDEWRRPRKTALLTMQYIGEGATITSSDNTYDLITLVPRKYGGLMLVSNELMDDSAVSIADQFAQSVAEGQALAEDQAYFNGDGSATYGNQTGLANGLPSGAYLAAGANWAANTMTSAILPPGSVENIFPGSQASWAMSRQAFYQVFGRLFNAGGGNRNIDLATYSLSNPGPGGANASINGEPVYFTQVLSTSTPSTGVPWAFYGDFSGASMLGLHTDLRIVSDQSRYLDTDQMAFRAISRFSVNIHGDGRGSTVGPIAALKTT